MSIDWNRFCEVINDHQKFLLTSHIRPDCDALGSELGMAGILEKLGKEVVIVNGQVTPPNFDFLDPDKRIKAINVDVQPEDLEDIEVLMILDTSAWAQLGPMGDVIRSTQAKVIVVDHHVSEDDLGAEPFKNTTAEATGRLVVEAADALGVALDETIATPVFAALATDTGWYRFGSTSSYTYRIAGRLVDAGASPAGIYQNLYERESLGRLKLRGSTLARVESEMDGKFVHTYIELDDFERTGAIPSDTEDLINETLTVDDTLVAVILIEQRTGGFKISFRSRCGLSCSEVAEIFGGGGHKAAAGAFMEGTLDEVRPRLLETVRAELLKVL